MAVKSRHTFLCINLHVNIEIYCQDDHIRDDVERSNTHKDLGIFEWDLLGYLHHTKNDY